MAAEAMAKSVSSSPFKTATAALTCVSALMVYVVTICAAKLNRTCCGPTLKTTLASPDPSPPLPPSPPSDDVVVVDVNDSLVGSADPQRDKTASQNPTCTSVVAASPTARRCAAFRSNRRWNSRYGDSFNRSPSGSF